LKKDQQLELKKFDPPLILKPYETVSISFSKYSALYLGSDIVLPEFMFSHMKLYVDIGNKLVECLEERRQNSLECFSQITKSTIEFNGHVFNESVGYILCYFYDEKPHVAFIDKSGLIGNEWDFACNHLGKKNASVDDVKEFLNVGGLGTIFSNYLCFKVAYPKTELVFKKSIDRQVT